MAATITTLPPDIAYSLDHTEVELTTDAIDTAVVSNLKLGVIGTGPGNTQTLRIAWLSNDLTFVVATTPDDSGLQVPEKTGGETLPAYADRLAEALRENATLHDQFSIVRGATVGNQEIIDLVSRSRGVLGLAVTDGWTNVNTTVADSAPTAATNLMANLQVCIPQADGDDTPLLTLTAPYDFLSAKAQFNLRAVLPLSPALPNTSSIVKPTIVFVWMHGIAVSASTPYFLRAADASGLPIVLGSLKKSATKYMIYGATVGDSAPATTLGFVRLGHHYQRSDGVAFEKTVALEQPDWVYAFLKVAATDCFVEITLSWSDNSTETVTAPGSTFDVEQYKMYWFAAGPLQHRLDLFTPPAADVFIEKYTWRLKGTVGGSVTTLVTVLFEIMQHDPEWQRLFLAFDNGKGGIETVPLRGKTKNLYAAEREIARQPVFPGHQPAQAEDVQYFAEAQEVFEVSTGYVRKWYVEHLKQVLLGKLWLVDTRRKLFLPVVMTSDALDVTEDDQDIHQLSFTIRAAWTDAAYQDV